MRNILFVLLFISFSFFSCMEKCKNKDVTAYYYLPEMQNYFGMYRIGNYWIYKNQNNTKTDSLYVTDFIEEIKKEKIECITYPTIKFKLHSKYLMINGDTIINGVFENNQNCCVNYFYCAIGAQMNSSINTHPVSNTNILELLIDSLEIRNVTYKNVLFFNNKDEYYNLDTKAYFSPNVGIVQFINQNDTFSLTHYYLQ